MLRRGASHGLGAANRRTYEKPWLNNVQRRTSAPPKEVSSKAASSRRNSPSPAPLGVAVLQAGHATDDAGSPKRRDSGVDRSGSCGAAVPSRRPAVSAELVLSGGPQPGSLLGGAASDGDHTPGRARGLPSGDAEKSPAPPQSPAKAARSRSPDAKAPAPLTAKVDSPAASRSAPSSRSARDLQSRPAARRSPRGQGERSGIEAVGRSRHYGSEATSPMPPSPSMSSTLRSRHYSSVPVLPTRRLPEGGVEGRGLPGRRAELEEQRAYAGGWGERHAFGAGTSSRRPCPAYLGEEDANDLHHNGDHFGFSLGLRGETYKNEVRPLETPREAALRRKREAADVEMARIAEATMLHIVAQPIRRRGVGEGASGNSVGPPSNLGTNAVYGEADAHRSFCLEELRSPSRAVGGGNVPWVHDGEARETGETQRRFSRGSAPWARYDDGEASAEVQRRGSRGGAVPWARAEEAEETPEVHRRDTRGSTVPWARDDDDEDFAEAQRSRTRGSPSSSPPASSIPSPKLHNGVDRLPVHGRASYPNGDQQLLFWGPRELGESPRMAARRRKCEASDRDLLELKAQQAGAAGSARQIAHQLRDLHTRAFLAPFATGSGDGHCSDGLDRGMALPMLRPVAPVGRSSAFPARPALEPRCQTSDVELECATVLSVELPGHSVLTAWTEQEGLV